MYMINPAKQAAEATKAVTVSMDAIRRSEAALRWVKRSNRRSPDRERRDNDRNMSENDGISCELWCRIR
jgi:hypothetical protein